MAFPILCSASGMSLIIIDSWKKPSTGENQSARFKSIEVMNRNDTKQCNAAHLFCICRSGFRVPQSVAKALSASRQRGSKLLQASLHYSWGGSPMLWLALDCSRRDTLHMSQAELSPFSESLQAGKVTTYCDIAENCRILKSYIPLVVW